MAQKGTKLKQKRNYWFKKDKCKKSKSLFTYSVQYNLKFVTLGKK
jgi:hypothetical protein